MKKSTDRICYFYLPESALNEATIYYCGLVRKAFDQLEFSIVDIDNIDENKIDACSTSFTVRIIDYLKIYKVCKVNVFWFQGILPEEVLLTEGKSIKSKLRYYYISNKEKKVLRTSPLCLFVSRSMREHYRQKYRLSRALESVIIPCYNQTIKESSFYYENKYSNFDFVYAGSLINWQCVEEAMQVFKLILAKAPTATFTILTNNIAKVNFLIEKYTLHNVYTDYVPLEILQEYLGRFKYAFLLRKEDKVNRVSTPTKMNSYLASGLVPIYTNVVDSFEENINLEQFGIKVSLEKESLEDIAEKIILHHQLKIDPAAIIQHYRVLFENYYNDDLYVKQLRLKIAEKWELE